MFEKRNTSPILAFVDPEARYNFSAEVVQKLLSMFYLLRKLEWELIVTMRLPEFISSSICYAYPGLYMLLRCVYCFIFP